MRFIKVNYGESEINLDIWWDMAPLAPNAETSLLLLISLIFLFSARPNPDTSLRLYFPTQLKPWPEKFCRRNVFLFCLLKNVFLHSHCSPHSSPLPRCCKWFCCYCLHCYHRGSTRVWWWPAWLRHIILRTGADRWDQIICRCLLLTRVFSPNCEHTGSETHAWYKSAL